MAGSIAEELYEKLTQEPFNSDLDEENRQDLRAKIAEWTHKLQTNNRQTFFLLKQLKSDSSKLKDNLEKQQQLEQENTDLQYDCKLQGVRISKKQNLIKFPIN